MGFLGGSGRFAVGSSYHADAQAMFDAIGVNAGTISAGTKTIYSTLITTLDTTYSIWTELRRLFWLPVGDQWAAACMFFKNGTPTALTSVGVGSYGDGDYSEAVGVTGRAATGLATGFIPSVSLTVDSTHIWAYIRDANTNGLAGLGCHDGTNRCAAFFPASNNFYSDQYNSSAGRTSVGGSGAVGLLSASRVAASGAGAHIIYRNGSAIKTDTGASGSALSTTAVNFASVNGNGSVDNPTAGTLWAGAGMSGKLDATQSANFYTAMQTAQTSLARQV